MNKLRTSFVSLLVLLFFVSVVNVNAQALPYVELTVDGSHPGIYAKKGKSVVLSWRSSPEVSDCSLSGSYAKDTFGRVVSADPYYSNLPASGEVTLYAEGVYMKNIERLDYTIQCYYLTSPNRIKETKDSVYISLYDKEANPITIKTPSEGTVWKIGKTAKIKWLSNKKESPKVDIVLERDTFSINPYDKYASFYIKSNIKNKGNLSWRIPKDFAPGNYKISVAEPTGDFITASRGETSYYISIVK